MSTDTASSPDTARRSGAETARRVLNVLLHFNSHRPTASVRDIALACELPMPTAHRYVALLKEMGLIEEASRGLYQLGWRSLQLGHAASRANSLIAVAEPFLQRIARATDETVVVFRLAGLDMECIGQIASQHVFRPHFDPGQRVPLTAGASARVLLSGLSDDVLRETLDALESRYPSFVDRRPGFEADIRATRKRGWATSREEIDPGIWAVAAPIIDNDRVAAGVSVSGPLYRLEERRHDDVIRQLTAAVHEINMALAARAKT